MKVTTIIDYELIQEAMKYSNTKSISEAVKKALSDYVSHKKLLELTKEIEAYSLKYKLDAGKF